ncbi:hypothetical protein LSAT2_006894 [Lamellibrachia satsuma]|nr:hypothetical protein LSAT2_006894 [Lamellibrachia satsuma]
MMSTLKVFLLDNLVTRLTCVNDPDETGVHLDISKNIRPCGGYLKLTETSGYIESPNYPDHYPNMAHCIWQLQAPTDHVITMTVTAVRGEADYTEQCIDYVEIRNGSGTSTVMFKLCVSSSPVSLQSTDRWLWVRFKSNHVTTNSGFRASWATEFVPPLGTLKGVSPIPGT